MPPEASGGVMLTVRRLSGAQVKHVLAGRINNKAQVDNKYRQDRVEEVEISRTNTKRQVPAVIMSR